MKRLSFPTPLYFFLSAMRRRFREEDFIARGGRGGKERLWSGSSRRKRIFEKTSLSDNGMLVFVGTFYGLLLFYIHSLLLVKVKLTHADYRFTCSEWVRLHNVLCVHPIRLLFLLALRVPSSANSFCWCQRWATSRAAAWFRARPSTLCSFLRNREVFRISDTANDLRMCLTVAAAPLQPQGEKTWQQYMWLML